jgi:hypothetical protein
VSKIVTFWLIFIILAAVLSYVSGDLYPLETAESNHFPGSSEFLLRVTVTAADSNRIFPFPPFRLDMMYYYYARRFDKLSPVWGRDDEDLEMKIKRRDALNISGMI